MADSIVIANHSAGQSRPARKPHQSIRRKSSRARGVLRLPFVAGWRTKQAPLAPCWNVPATGGYMGGCEVGKAMALSYLRHQRNQAAPGTLDAGTLTSIVVSFMIRFEQEGGRAMLDVVPLSGQSERFTALRGQYVGFFSTLSEWLNAATKYLGESLDSIDEGALVDRANAWLRFDEKAAIAASERGDRNLDQHAQALSAGAAR